MMGLAGSENSSRGFARETFLENHPRIFGVFLILALLFLLAFSIFLVSDILSFQSISGKEELAAGINLSEQQEALGWKQSLEKLNGAGNHILAGIGLKTEDSSSSVGENAASSAAANETDRSNADPAKKAETEASPASGNSEISSEDASLPSSADSGASLASKSYVTYPVKSSHRSSRDKDSRSHSGSSGSSAKSLSPLSQAVASNLSADNESTSRSAADQVMSGMLLQPEDGPSLPANNSTAHPPIADADEILAPENNVSKESISSAESLSPLSQAVGNLGADNASASRPGADQAVSGMLLQPEDDPSLPANNSTAHPPIADADDSSAPENNPSNGSVSSESDSAALATSDLPEAADLEIPPVPGQGEDLLSQPRPSLPEESDRAPAASETADEPQSLSSDPAAEGRPGSSPAGEEISSPSPDQSGGRPAESPAVRNRQHRVRPTPPARPQANRESGETINPGEISEPQETPGDEAEPQLQTDPAPDRSRSNIPRRPERPAAPVRPTIRR